jgi:hypothetical protein
MWELQSTLKVSLQKNFPLLFFTFFRTINFLLFSKVFTKVLNNNSELDNITGTECTHSGDCRFLAYIPLPHDGKIIPGW